jgi:predicted nucleic acid-binding protein
MTEMVLIDSNAWIDYFKSGNYRYRDKIIELLEEDKVAACGIVITELLHGAKTPKEAKIIKEYITGVNIFDINTDNYINAGILGGFLRKKGITVPLPDLIIAEICISNKIQLFTNDKHFIEISKNSNLFLADLH